MAVPNTPGEVAPLASQNNSLEFVAALVSVWAAILSEEAPKETCFLALGDNSSAVGWLHKANVDDSKNLPLHMAARKYVEILLQADCCLYSQHIPGKKSIVANILSRKFDLSHHDLTFFHCIKLSFPGLTKLQCLSSPARNTLMTDLMAAEIQRENEVTKGTRDKEQRVWKHWIEYTRCINFEHDIWLQYLPPES